MFEIATFVGAGEKEKKGRTFTISPTLILDALSIWEMVIIVTTGVIVKYIWFEEPSDGLGTLKLGIVLAVISSFVLRKLSLYKPAALVHSAVQILAVVSGIGISFVSLFALLFTLESNQGYSLSWLLTWFLASGLALTLGRVLARYCIQRMQLQDRFKIRVALYGSDLQLRKVSEALRGSPNFTIVRRFPAEKRLGFGPSEVLEALINFGQTNNCDLVAVALPLSSSKQIKEASEKLSILPMDVILLSELLPLPVKIRDCQMLGGFHALHLQSRPLSDRQNLIKSVIDRSVSIAALTLMMPVFLLIAIAIKIDSRGSVFFIQRRNGYNHSIIRVIKFRTMYVKEDDGEIRQAKVDDARITRVGRFLRTTSLDELPQLWNVLIGEMSLVGPRPHALSHNKFYAGLWERYSGRHRVKPGITGWAQVNGLRGETSDPEQMCKRAELDLNYIENWSLWFDFLIICKTVGIVCSGKNAH
jgi:Undecaprenyl-phosphate glucose phosphotransferase